MAKELRFSLSGVEYASAPVKLGRKKMSDFLITKIIIDKTYLLWQILKLKMA